MSVISKPLFSMDFWDAASEEDLKTVKSFIEVIGVNFVY